jgi:hypothetical protein
MSIEDHKFRRDNVGMRQYSCCECKIERPDYMIYERRGQLYCPRCMLNTAEKRAFERWFVDSGA